MARSLLSDFIGDDLEGQARSAEEEAAFGRHCQDLSRRGMRMLAGFMIAGNLLCWPSDLLVFVHEPMALRLMAQWRLTLLICCVTSLLLMRVERIYRHKWFMPAIDVMIILSALTGGRWVSQVGGLEQPFYYAIYTFAGISTTLFISLSHRVLLTYGLSGSFLLSFFGTRPIHLHHPRLISTLEVLFAANLCYVLLGHIIYLLVRKTYFQGLALERKARELAVAHEKSDRLLLNILPAAIASRLKEEQRPIADGFASVTVLFADIVGFTALSSTMPPQELVQLLNRVFSDFDRQVEALGLEKIKTIGDAYMVAGGLPIPRPDHAEAIADMALAMREAVARYCGGDHAPLRIRIGIHSGPVVAGVIGSKKFIYDLWGDTVNTASRMESQGVPDEIQVSEATQRLLAASFTLESRGEINVKGIGPLPTWLLRGRRD